MPDRIEELVARVLDIFTHTHNPETDEWELSGDIDQYPAYRALAELATIARERDAAVAVVEAARSHLEYCDGSGYPIPDALALYDALGRSK